MNWLDFILIVIIGFCLVRGIFRGIIKEICSIVGVIGGFYAAYTYYPQVAELLSRWISNSTYLNVISCFALFISVFLVVSIIGVVIKYMMSIVFLGWTDRICGAFFGTLKGVLISAVIVMVLTVFLPQHVKIIKNSHIAREMIRLSQTLVQVTSKDMKRQFSVKLKELNKSWQRGNS